MNILDVRSFRFVITSNFNERSKEEIGLRGGRRTRRSNNIKLYFRSNTMILSLRRGIKIKMTIATNALEFC